MVSEQRRLLDFGKRAKSLKEKQDSQLLPMQGRAAGRLHLWSTGGKCKDKHLGEIICKKLNIPFKPFEDVGENIWGGVRVLFNSLYPSTVSDKPDD